MDGNSAEVFDGILDDKLSLRHRGGQGVTVLQCLSTQAFLRCKTAGVTAQHHGLNLEGVQC